MTFLTPPSPPPPIIHYKTPDIHSCFFYKQQNRTWWYVSLLFLNFWNFKCFFFSVHEIIRCWFNFVGFFLFPFNFLQVGPGSIPHWLGVLLGQKFFDPCILHESAKKNEKNIFCLNCCITICPHCLPLHRHHRRLQVHSSIICPRIVLKFTVADQIHSVFPCTQIRRYVYRDVIRLSDAQKLINCSLVQVWK